MVKLSFKPDNTTNVVTSKTSKKEQLNLNPFADIENIENVENVENVEKIVGLENTQYVLKNWYFTTVPKKPLLIIGPIGCGKTSLVELFCRQNNIQLYRVKVTDLIKTKREIISDIALFSGYSFTNFFIKSEYKSRKLVFIDEYPNGPNDLLSITDIINLSTTLPPILIISSDPRGSKLTELKNICDVHYIGNIQQCVIVDWIQTLFNNLDKEYIINLVEKCKSDKRSLLNAITLKSKNFKDDDINIFEYTQTLFNTQDYPGMDDSFKVYQTDGFMVASLVQENYLDYNDSLELLARSADAISIGDVIFSGTYDSGRVFLPDSHWLNAVCLPTYFSKSDYKHTKGIFRSNCNNNRYNIYLNNQKVMNRIVFDSTFTIFDILYIKKFINYQTIKNSKNGIATESFIKNILHTFKNEVAIEKLELIYKHFSEFKDSQNNKTKSFTIKFKEKLKALLWNN